jgi:hypothetical protein
LLHLVLVILLHLVLVGLPYRRVPSYLGAAPEPFGVLNKQFPDSLDFDARCNQKLRKVLLLCSRDGSGSARPRICSPVDF